MSHTPTTPAERVLAVLRDPARMAAVHTIASETGLDPDTVLATLRRLERKGTVIHLVGEFWTLKP